MSFAYLNFFHWSSFKKTELDTVILLNDSFICLLNNEQPVISSFECSGLKENIIRVSMISTGIRRIRLWCTLWLVPDI